MRNLHILLGATLGIGAPALAAPPGVDTAPGFGVRLVYEPEPPADDAPPAAQAPEPFGTAGQDWITAGLGVAWDPEESTDTNIRLAWSRFLIDNIEFSVELNGWYFNQDGDNASGINPAMVFRWHFYNCGPWTIYGDAGIGVLFATDSVPAGGTDVDFTPRFGVGFTRELNAESRLQVGLRWHHISNARILGDSDNPARDAPMLYAGVMWKF